MKLSKIALMGLAFVASNSLSQAQTTIYFSASNGDRNATQVAISRTLTNWTYRGLTAGAAGAGGTGQASNDNFRTSNFGTWRGTWNGQLVIIKTNYAGALAGIAAVANQNIQVRFDSTNGTLPNPGTPGDAANKIPENPLTSTTPANYVESSVDFGLSTNFQATSPFLGTYNNVQYNAIKQIPVGISQLGFYGSPGTPVDNITTQQARLLYDTGAIPLSLITGNWTTDNTKYIYAIGRNTDAGQRFGAQLEIGRSGIGFQYLYQANPAPAAGGAANAPLIESPAGSGNWIANPSHDASKSYAIGTAVIGGTVSDHRQWNNGVDETFSGITSSGGHNSGANVAINLTYKLGSAAYKKADPAATAGWYVGYVTPGDASATILGTGQGLARPADSKGVALKFNGIENTPENVKSGKYTLWIYNRILTPLAGVAGKVGDPSPSFRADFVTALTNRIKIDVATQQGIALDDPDLKVHRTQDGGPVIPGPLPAEE
ncbi:MAG: hypothetical protein V4819_02130 [Verrucomicrobiota bacterium]